MAQLSRSQYIGSDEQKAKKQLAKDKAAAAKRQGLAPRTAMSNRYYWPGDDNNEARWIDNDESAPAPVAPEHAKQSKKRLGGSSLLRRKMNPNDTLLTGGTGLGNGPSVRKKTLLGSNPGKSGSTGGNKGRSGSSQGKR